MRDATRIPRIMSMLTQLWNKGPDQRFGQMMINADLIPTDLNTWNIEDDEWEDLIKKQLVRVEKRQAEAEE